MSTPSFAPVAAAHLLEGNGAGVVRELSVARSIQQRLERLYQIDGAPEITDFTRLAEDGDRETLFLRESGPGEIEIQLRVPRLAEGGLDFSDSASMDPVCQLIEGVSHFVYITHRAQSDRPTTQLELELQAEVDKYVVFIGAVEDLSVRTSRALRARLFEHVQYTHAPESDLGERYRLANDLAARFTRRLEREHLLRGSISSMREELRRFFRSGREEKMRAARETG